MFKNKTPKKVNSTTKTAPSLNMISEGTKIKGTVQSNNDIRIAGKVDGEAVCKSKIIITSSAYLSGNLTSAEADVAGNVEGVIKVTQKLTLRQSAVVGGDIYAKVLVVEEGAQLNGNCRMGAEADMLDEISDAEFEKATVKQEEKEKEEVS